MKFESRVKALELQRTTPDKEAEIIRDFQAWGEVVREQIRLITSAPVEEQNSLRYTGMCGSRRP
jgi:hypothetical protein